jgi:glucosamine--fructose-6-phosphate aminotransferase (isomerizing)
MGYVGPRQAAPLLLDGLRRLEYRGYDSAGIAVCNGAIQVRKAEGKIDRLAGLLDSNPIQGSVGIGHTRWATHGEPNDLNAHPHTAPSGEFVVVHNGIIENFARLKNALGTQGHEFTSDTDTEILAHLVARHYDGDLVAAVRTAVASAEGAYALVVISVHEPGKIVAVRRVSPLVVGLGEGETFLASDIPAVLHHTRDFMIVEDGELVVVTDEGASIEEIDGGRPVQRDVFHVDWDSARAEKGGYEHFMLKEIHEQPAVIAETLAGRLDDDDAVWLDAVGFDDGFARDLDRIWVTACGTAYHAGLVGKEIFSRLLRIPTTVEYAHEMRYADPLVAPGSLTVAISQSGETADTLAAARLARERGSRLLALTNVVGSTLSREADDILYTRAGPEISVASTKAYMAMLIGQYLLALRLGAARGLDPDVAARMRHGLHSLPGQVEAVLAAEDEIVNAAERLVGADDVYFIGRGLDYAIAMEGSLKLKEISYLHSEAMPAGELKHGTLALVTKGTPVVVVLTQQAVYDKTISAVQEVRARGGAVLAVAYHGDEAITDLADTVLRIPRSDDLFGPVAAVVPLQLLAYHVARLRGHDIDQPRNLAKSVTVE